MDEFLHTFFDVDSILTILPILLTEGLTNTLIISVSAVIAGLILGLVLAMMLMSRLWVLKVAARIYVDVFRGLPAILTISLVGLGFPAAGIRPFGTSPFGYAILAVGLISAAYTAEILRSGIQSIDKGQLQAGRSLGMTYFHAMRKIVVPQGVRNVLPALTNRFIIDIKESSLVYLLGLSVGQRELYFIAYQQQAVTYNSSALVAAGICYLMMTVPLTYIVNAWDRRLRSGRTRRRANSVPNESAMEVAK
ncbi:amino acid ABC transporter permease [Paramicrobacterium chengjingii]|uniref:Amino acid ABC transporter permease n=1 Tax=Paramicrobacterium chengjingii TaxID=2769067 RepID=A0ABX6YKE1_9MICO|nr:amino acid ABC transporter permease [Microbacterium chengjingii]QPZ39278.1 amino acid ABC transporter permease [Microbacterium chengjingii]